ncbi:hypothetical protein SAMN06295974_3862 [Plantibacter flavus]|uniref:Uncharacterized protein n=1 Tax=Plantibacter flavus TaxID=150123 RepID=A0A3N2BLE3_9MICO|nr:hypothetical protein [Plantibacter flavus]ROR75992.1 hypothetical protein EDD42_3944 [Plantibacter flavus]SMG49543.1 hypothetical protein SAMN06295974_3862 [Plantibacter flavus]
MCNPELIACQISTVTEAIGSWNWNSFFATVIATTIGGVIGLAAVWLGFWLQERRRYRERLDGHVIGILEQFLNHHELVFTRYASRNEGGMRGKLGVASRSAFAEIDSRLQISEVYARPRDRAVISFARTSVRLIDQVDVPFLRAILLNGVRNSLGDWRSGEITRDEAQDSLAELRIKIRRYR